MSGSYIIHETMVRRLAWVAFGLLLLAQGAGAQPLRAYVSSAVSAQWRDAFDGNANPSAVVNVSGGAFVSSWLALEASIVLPPDQSLDWTYAYSDAVSTNRASIGDLQIIGYVRVNAACYARMCVQPVAGLGINHRHAESVITATCGSLSIPRACTPVPNGSTDTSTRTVPALSFGLDVPVQVANHVRIGPSARFEYVSYDDYLFPYPGVDHRGPVNSGPWSIRVGLLVAFGR